MVNAAFVAGAAWLATALLYVDPGLWYAPVAEADPDYSQYEERGESLLFDQPRRIEVAAKMDLAEDVLFLALSSHGSPDYLVVSHGPLMLDDLTDEALAHALADAGIKWRVIVISACYSGSFIDALQNPHTIVIAAAAADRTSFGCNDERDLTYFGEAFYRDALPEADSLRKAFEVTVEAIAERERREDIEPSHPQAHFGDAIVEKLGSLALE